MGSALSLIEYGLGRLLFNIKAHDDKLFTKGPAYASCPEPTFEVDSPDCEPSNSIMKIEYTQLSEDRFPELKWSAPSPGIKEYLLVVEDADPPLPFTPMHGLYYAIPASTTTITNSNVRSVDPAGKEKTLKGGFKLGKNFRGARMDFALSKEDERYWASANSNQSELHCDLYGFVELFHVLLLCFPSLHASLSRIEA